MLHLSIIGAILDYIEDYTTKIKLEFERFCKQSRFTTQKNKIMCINKFGGENNSPPKKCNQRDNLYFLSDSGSDCGWCADF